MLVMMTKKLLKNFCLAVLKGKSPPRKWNVIMDLFLKINNPQSLHKEVEKVCKKYGWRYPYYPAVG